MISTISLMETPTIYLSSMYIIILDNFVSYLSFLFASFHLSWEIRLVGEVLCVVGWSVLVDGCPFVISIYHGCCLGSKY